MQNLETVTMPSYIPKRQTFSSSLFKMQISRDCELFYPQNAREFHLMNHRRWNKHKTDFFNDPECVMQLTKSLLKLDFGLKLELPDDRLCPPVGSISFLDASYDLTRLQVLNRHNYLLWLKELLDSTSYEKQDRKIVGLDIGTGASCIYPLMGCTERDWDFIATGNPFTTPLTRAPLIKADIDPKSLEYAYKNVTLNELGNRIKVVGRKPTDALIPLNDLNINNISFTMSNPPFYKSEEELLESARKKSRPPFTACTGAKVEMVTDGGEIAFVDRMLKESLALQERVQWYTSMFGFLTSLIEFVDKLREHKIDNYAITEFVQGSKTRRWAVAWSFGNMRPAQSVARGIKTAVSKNVLPEITEEKVVDIPLQEKIGNFADSFRSGLEKLDLIIWEWDSERLEGIGRAAGRVWARAWRRRKQRGEIEDQGVVDVKCEFAFKVYVRVGKDAVEVHCRWLEGHDPVTFESFRGYLKKTARNIVNLQSTEDKA
jgi:23S rRNA (adenine1618-N6)-methyltransferase